MVAHRFLVTCVVAVAVLATGCTSVIHIVTPGTGLSKEPVSQVQASFTVDFKPAEAWSITLDGVAITGFSPTPAPGVTSTAPLVLASSTPIAQHTIDTNATCGFFCVYPSDPPVKFTPPQLLYNTTLPPLSLINLKQFSAQLVFVGVQFDRSVPITVTITETSSLQIVKLGLSPATLQPVGTPLTVTIPATSTKADFYIESDSIGKYTLSFTATGVTPGGGAGTVSK